MNLKKITTCLIFTVILLTGFWFILIESKAPEKANALTASTIAFLGDAHMDRGTTNSIPELIKDFNVIKAQSPTGKVDAIFMSGDMETVNSVYKAYQASSANGIPIYFAPGNHDVSPNTVSDVKAKSWLFKTYPMHPGPTGTEKSTYSVDVGNTHVIVVNEYWDEGTNEAWFKYGGSEGAYIGPKLMSWIESDLKSTNTQYKVVVLHEPLYPSNRHIGDSLDKDKANRDAFQKILNDNGVDVVVAGHTHYSSAVKKGNILHVIDGVPGAKAGNNADPWASIWYTNVGVDGCLNITWKHENSNSWTSPTVKTYTSQCGTTGPTPTSQQPTPTSAPTPTGTYASSCDGQTTMTDSRDSQVYDIAQIGSQCWMAENINYGEYMAGKKSGGINHQNNDSKVEKYCWGDNSANCATYGGYYQWHEAMQLPKSCDNDDSCLSQINYPQQGICPSGWHIPSDVEDSGSPESNNDWYTLENYLKNSGQNCSATRDNVWACADAGTKMKTGGSSGLNLGIVGSIMEDGNGWIDMGADGHYWSSGATAYTGSESDPRVWARDFEPGQSGLKRKGKEKNRGFPVRCVKNSSLISPTPGPDTTPTTLLTPTPQPVTPTIYCLGSCNNPTASPSDQPLPSEGPTAPATPATIPPAPTAIAIVVIITILLILFRIVVLR